MKISKDIFRFVEYLIKQRSIIIGILVFFIMSYMLNAFFFDSVPVKLKNNITVFISGDSQIKYGLNPDIIKNSINMGQDVEPYFITYNKLKYVYKYNKQLKKVIVPCTPMHFIRTFDNVFISKVYVNEMLRRAMYLVKPEDRKLLDLKWIDYAEIFIRYKFIINYKFFVNYFNKVLLKKEGLPDYPFIGEYTRNPDIPMGKIDVNYLIKEKFEGYTEPRGLIDATYLDSIVKFSQDNDLQLYLVEMPIPKELYEKIPPDVIAYTDKKVRNYQVQGDVMFINCLTCFNNEYFVDFGHLTGKGSDKCSSFIEKKINN